MSIMMKTVTSTFLLIPTKSSPLANSFVKKNAAIPIPIFITIIKDKIILPQILSFHGFDLYKNNTSVGDCTLKQINSIVVEKVF